MPLSQSKRRLIVFRLPVSSGCSFVHLFVRFSAHSCHHNNSITTGANSSIIIPLKNLIKSRSSSKMDDLDLFFSAIGADKRKSLLSRY